MNLQIKNYELGSDFEVFVKDVKKNKILNAQPYVKGTKDAPFNFDISNRFWATSLDNVLAEGNIPPAKNAQDFSDYILKTLLYIKNNLPKNLELKAFPAEELDEDQFFTEESLLFGCDPDYSAYTFNVLDKISAKSVKLRSGCCHVHLRYEDMENDPQFNVKTIVFIRMMDLYLGLPSIIIEPENARRILYGQAGSYRADKNKTIEYRVLSNYFLNTEELRKWVFENTQLVIEKINNNDIPNEKETFIIKKIIEDNNYEEALNMINKYNIPMPNAEYNKKMYDFLNLENKKVA